MPVQVTYPGVYIQELPSGQHTIAGVPTSIAAFIGRAVRGAVDEPITLFNYGDYERQFGGLHADYPLSYAVQDFFVNGGGQAVVIRMANEDKTGLPSGIHAAAKAQIEAKSVPPSKKKEEPPAGEINQDKEKNKEKEKPPTPPADSQEPSTDIPLEAQTIGIWGNNLTVKVDTKGISGLEKMGSYFHNNFGKYGLKTSDLFNVTVTLTTPNGTPVVETFSHVSVSKANAPSYLPTVLKNQSQLVQLKSSVTTPLTTAPPEATWAFSGGVDSPPLGIDTKTTGLGDQAQKTGLYALDKTDIFNILCIPPDSSDGDIAPPVYSAALEYCVKRRAMLIVDPPNDWQTDAKKGELSKIDLTALEMTGDNARNAAVYFPRVLKADPEMNGHVRAFPACGMIAGIYANTDTTVGVWKAPAGQNAALQGVAGLTYKLNDDENGILNPQGINCLRDFQVVGSVVWGSLTMRGAAQLSDPYMFIPVRRLTMYIESSLQEGTRWAVFEPNDATLWASLKLSADTFLANLMRQGAFYEYQVICDASTTTKTDIELGIVNLKILIAPVKPAEFIVIQIQQQAG